MPEARPTRANAPTTKDLILGILGVMTKVFPGMLVGCVLLSVGCGGEGPSPLVDGGVLDMGDGGPPPTPSARVDPTCRDGMYAEVPPDLSVSVADLAFSGDVAGFVDASLARRYPFGGSLVASGRMDTRFGGDCSVIFAGSPTSAADVFRSLDTIVHECGHFADGRLSTGPRNTYLIQSELTYACERGDTTTRGGDTFARSRIRTDEYQALRPPCDSPGQRGCDGYANIYLNGDPDDAMFESGDQGFNLLLEETVQYVNSLVTAYAFSDQIRPGSSTSARDGILTFLWYVERYLHLARSTYPDAYARISGDACFRDAILTVWGRAWLFLERTRDLGALGIEDDVLETYVSDPVLLDEIERLRVLAGC